MADPLEIIGRPLGSPGAISQTGLDPLSIIGAPLKRARSTRDRPGLDELREEVALLEQEQEAFGAPGIEQEKPGVFRRLVDLLSRPNFATAGFVDEIIQGKSITAGLGRAMTELFSGVGSLQGQKEAFGEVLEDAGVGTKTLADAFPALEGTWVGNFGSRGALGLALDIGTDPLTYMTFGAGSGVKALTSKGVRYLNRTGAGEFSKLISKHVKRLRPKGSLDAIDQTSVFTKAREEAMKEFEQLFKVGDDISSEMLEKGGAKLFGKTVPGTDKIGGAIGKAVDMLPESVTKPVIEGATAMKEGMARSVRGLFSSEGAFANLPESIRIKAVELTNNFFRSSIAHRTHLMGQMKKFERVYRKIEKVDDKIGQRWHDLREGVPGAKPITNAEELEAFNGTMALYDSMGETMVRHGVIPLEKMRKNYIFHAYKNIEDLAQFHPNKTGKGTGSLGSGGKIIEDRVFDTLRDAEKISKELHDDALQQMAKGEADRLYPVLEPNYDVFENMTAYIGKHSDLTARTAWREEMATRFGKTLDELVDPDAVYDAAGRGVPIKDTPGAPKDFAPETVPLRRVIQEGDIEKTLVDKFGPEGAQYVAIKSKLTDDELVYMPKAIAEALESVNSKLFNTKDYKEFGKLLKGFDWLNNNFKWGVYTIWPASATRDGYSNIALSMLRVGVAALDPRKHIDTIKLMAKRNLGDMFANSGYTIGQLRELSKTFGVWVPGQVFVEQTGRFKLGKFRRSLTEARAGIENEARVTLWMEEIRRGADPRTAADTVGEFLFNYGEVSRVERDLFRRLIPFYTFTRKNIELQWKMLRRNPGMQINQLKPFRGRTEENEQMVQWEAEGLKMRMDKDGKTVHMLTGIDLPLRNLDTIWRGDLGKTGRSIVGMVTPVLKVIPEILLNQDFFLGRDMTRTQSGTIGKMIDVLPTPQPVKDWLGYRKKVDDAGRSKYTFDGRRFTLLFRSWMLSRAVSTGDRQFRENMDAGGVQWQRMMLDVMTGLRVKSVDLDEQMQRRLSARIRQLEEALARRGARETFRKRFKPRDFDPASLQ